MPGKLRERQAGGFVEEVEFGLGLEGHLGFEKEGGFSSEGEGSERFRGVEAGPSLACRAEHTRG